MREVKEETGLTLLKYMPRGVVTFLYGNAANPEDRVALNTLDTYYAAMGFVTNVMRSGWLLSSPQNAK